MTNDLERVDICVFGASGFTGAYVCEEIAGLIQSGRNITFAFAGRDKQRIEAVKQRIIQSPRFYQATKDKIRAAPVIICDSRNRDSIYEMCKKTKVLLNCVGPFRFHGLQVVEGCVMAGTHYLDISGEPEFMEEAILRYDVLAREKKVLVVSACGFDSIPADLGCAFSRNQARNAGILPTAIESYLSLKSGKDGFVGNYATWESAVYGFGSVRNLRALRKKLAEKYAAHPIPVYGCSKPPKGPFAWSEFMNRWCLPFPGSDASVVLRSQRQVVMTNPTNAATAAATASRNDPLPLLPIQYSAYFTVPSTRWLLVTLGLGAIFQWLAGTSWGAKLLLTFPRVFSNGTFSKNGPTKKQMENTFFSMRFKVLGYADHDKQSEVLSKPFFRSSSNSSTATSTRIQTPPDTVLTTEISGPEPGYITTPRCLLACALLILQKTPSAGVLSPGAAFSAEDLVPLLQERGIRFEVLSQNTIDQQAGKKRQ